ncbi:ribosome hibernation-promoting factor, HPF/YfiA family [Salinimicrobium sediminilitoris]|uniref:ribosome hibernation-promoting factor, HPF/YfiA family n=1 Tax=Salinimicrobium sediminilitoris TaxID=2876715 RepID=UPI001E35DC8F|nr:ribosome-associated translation inhibitor RaiA [Salinimicrobium sediminilitoris]MCC8360555.1 ribosome-associated translation inhibitor RaiA [Salinimicrobium sediminilitoris]
MKVNVQSVNFHADQKLVNFIQRKLDKLENHFDNVIYADVYLKVEKASDKENKLTEILLSLPGDEIICKKRGRKFEVGVDECVSSLERQLQKRKPKFNAQVA